MNELATDVWTQLDTGSHLSDRWLNLLPQTALPPGACVSCHDVGADGSTSVSYLLTSLEHPHEIRSPLSFYSPICGPTADAAIDSSRLTTLFREIRMSGKRPAIIHLALLDTNSRFFSLVVQALCDAGCLASTPPAFWGLAAAAKRFTGKLVRRLRGSICYNYLVVSVRIQPCT